MNSAVHCLAAAGLAAILVSLAPKILLVRIRIFRFLRLTWLADFHERHFDGIVVTARALLSAIAVYLIWLGLRAV